MYIVVCLDTMGGILFNNRRQSRDSVIVNDVVNMAGEKLYMSAYSKKLFKDVDGITVGEEFPFTYDEGAYCFAECEIPEEAVDKAEGFVIYHWNKLYPQDVSFDISLVKNNFKLESSEDLVGTSHDKITKEIWKK
ncbi:MAG: hypothetical protein IKL21_00565 [Clostridia bacterium]|nr:hypothetical protein [Clostridia bacterium]